jgi:lipoyl(octanoyl) transferase
MKDEIIIINNSYWEIKDLNTISYKDALDLQNELLDKAMNTNSHYILLLEHLPVITLGRRTDPSHLLFSQKELEKKGIDLFNVNRGGSATYHGPGQLVGYIITKVSKHGGVHALVSKVLSSIHQLISEMGLEVVIDNEMPGVWTKTDIPRKLSAVGMQIKNGYSLHGFALNINTSLEGFSMIVPCGLPNPVSTLSIELGRKLTVEEIKLKIKKILIENLMY